MTNKKNKQKKANAKVKANEQPQEVVPKSKQQSSLAKATEEKKNSTTIEVTNEIMLSVHCGTMLGHANKLKDVLLASGYAVFLCDQMQVGEDFRDEISKHASQCKAFIPFINKQWCQSRECGYEFKIAVRKNLINKGIPALLPLLLEDFKVYDDYPSVYGILCSTNGIRVDPSQLCHKTWTQILNALLMHDIMPTSHIPSSPSLPPRPPPVVEDSSSDKPGSFVQVTVVEKNSLRELSLFPTHVWEDILFFSTISTLGQWCQVATAFYCPSKRLLGGVVSTLAGTGKSGSADSLTQFATFNDICGLSVNPLNGDIFVAEYGNNKIRQISEGSVATFAGMGGQGYDDGLSAEAVFKMPMDVAVDLNGNVFVADTWNCLIRKISAAGVVSTYAGVFGDSGSCDGPAKEAMFNCPEGIAVDQAGIVYVADSKGNKIRKITPEGIVSTIAGSGKRGGTDGNCSEASFSYPIGLTINKQGEYSWRML